MEEMKFRIWQGVVILAAGVAMLLLMRPSTVAPDAVESTGNDTAQEVQQRNEQPEPADTSDWVTADWTEYQNATLGFALRYPAGWHVDDKGSAQGADFFSPDYEAIHELGPSVAAGMWLEVIVNDDPDDADIAGQAPEVYEESQRIFGGTFAKTSLGGEDATFSTIQPHGTSMMVTAFHDGRKYFVRLNTLDQDKPENRTLFGAILSTFAFTDPAAE